MVKPVKLKELSQSNLLFLVFIKESSSLRWNRPRRNLILVQLLSDHMQKDSGLLQLGAYLSSFGHHFSRSVMRHFLFLIFRLFFWSCLFGKFSSLFKTWLIVYHDCSCFVPHLSYFQACHCLSQKSPRGAQSYITNVRNSENESQAVINLNYPSKRAAMTIKEHDRPGACELNASLLDNCTQAEVIYNNLK